MIAIVGPTAVGKTAVAEALAARIGGEIISADAMQVYRGMDIGTAKPSPAERAVPYHCIDLVEPGEAYSAARYQADARAAIADIHARGHHAVLCGGTGLYVRAAVDDWTFPAGEPSTATRDRLDALARELGPEGLHALLARRDPDAAALIHPNNVRRVVRALEMLETGASYARQAERFSVRESIFPTVFVGLTCERYALYSRIDARVDAMVDAGLLDEVRGLLEHGLRDALTAQQAIGYKELVPVLESGTDLAAAVDDIKRTTRRYAKRQLTWFRADPRVVWLDSTATTPAEILGYVLDIVESAQQHR